MRVVCNYVHMISSPSRCFHTGGVPLVHQLAAAALGALRVRVLRQGHHLAQQPDKSERRFSELLHRSERFARARHTSFRCSTHMPTRPSTSSLKSQLCTCRMRHDFLGRRACAPPIIPVESLCPDAGHAGEPRRFTARHVQGAPLQREVQLPEQLRHSAVVPLHQRSHAF